MIRHLIFGLVATVSLASCAQQEVSSVHQKSAKNMKDLDSLQTAYFASGCFWCVEEIFESVQGVEEAVSGYAGGTEKNPTYYEVGSGKTGHAEAVEVYYDSTIISFSTLVDVFFNSHDPSIKDGQGPDYGRQYRSIAFYQTDGEKKIIEEKIDSLLRNKVHRTITTEVTLLDKFYDAEEYHQDYVRLNPNQSYVRAVSIPRLNAFKEKMPEVLK